MKDITRRDAIKKTIVASAALLGTGVLVEDVLAETPHDDGPWVLVLEQPVQKSLIAPMYFPISEGQQFKSEYLLTWNGVQE